MVVSPLRPPVPPKVPSPPREGPARRGTKLGESQHQDPKGLTSLDSSREKRVREGELWAWGPVSQTWVVALGFAIYLYGSEEEPLVFDP